MTAPAVASVTLSNQSPNGTTSTLTLPATFNTDDLLIGVLGADSGAAAMTWPAGWTEDLDSNAITGVIASLGHRKAVAGDTAPGVTHTSERSNHFMIRVTGWDTAVAPEFSTLATGSSTAPDPPSISPSWGTSRDTLIIVVAFNDDSAGPTYTGFPTANDNNQNGTSTSACRIAMCTTSGNAASFDVGAFTLSGSETWGAIAIAIAGPASSGPQDVTLGLLDASATLYAPTLTPKNAISLGLLDASAALYAPTIVAGPAAISLPLLDGAATLYAPTIQPGPVGITLGLLDASAALYAPTLAAKNAITLGLLDASPALYAPTVIPGPVGITLGLLDGAAALYAPTVALAPYPVTLPLLDGGAALYAPTLVGKNLIDLGLLDAGAALYAPTLVQPGSGTQDVTLALLDGAAALYAPTISLAPYPLTLPLLDGGAALYAPTLAPIVNVVLPLLDGAAALYAPTLTVGAVTVVLPLLDGAAALYAPTIAGAAYAIAGVTRNATGGFLGGVTLHLFRTSDDVEIAQTTSAVDGTFSFNVPDNTTSYYIVAYKAGTPDRAGASVNTLVGS